MWKSTFPSTSTDNKRRMKKLKKKHPEIFNRMKRKLSKEFSQNSLCWTLKSDEKYIKANHRVLPASGGNANHSTIFKFH